MNKFIKLIALAIALSFISTACQKESESIINPKSKGSARDGITLDEVTVTAYKDFSNFAASVATLYIGNDYTSHVSLYTQMTEEYQGEDIDNLPGLLDKILTRLNQIRQQRGEPAFNDQEMALLRTLKIVQVIKIFLAIEAAEDFAKHCLTTEFTTEKEDGGYANAFKHVYLSFDLAKTLGDVDLARSFTNAHEQGSPLITSPLSEMDFKNNDIGFAFYRQQYDWVSFDMLMQLAKNAYLWTMQSDGTVRQVPYIPPTRNQGPQN